MSAFGNGSHTMKTPSSKQLYYHQQYGSQQTQQQIQSQQTQNPNQTQNSAHQQQYPPPFSQCLSPIIPHHPRPPQHAPRSQESFNFSTNVSPVSKSNKNKSSSSALMTSPISRKANVNTHSNMNIKGSIMDTPDSFRNFSVSETPTGSDLSFTSPNISSITSKTSMSNDAKNLIYKTNNNDVISGNFRKGIGGQKGNKIFRKLVNDRAHRLFKDDSKEIPDTSVVKSLAEQIVQDIKNLEPPGRFLKFEKMENFDSIQEGSFSSIERDLDINSFSKYHSNGEIPVFVLSTQVEAMRKVSVAIRDKRNSLRKKATKGETDSSHTESVKSSVSNPQTPHTNQSQMQYGPNYTPSPFPFSMFSPSTPHSYPQYHQHMPHKEGMQPPEGYYPNTNLFPTPLQSNQTIHKSNRIEKGQVKIEASTQQNINAHASTTNKRNIKKNRKGKEAEQEDIHWGDRDMLTKQRGFNELVSIFFVCIDSIFSCLLFNN